MQKVPYKQGLVVAALTLSLVGSALAVDQVKTGDTQTSASTTQASQEKAAQEKAAQEKREANKAKLADAKLKLCKKREASVNNTMSRISSRGEKQIDAFNKISDRTQAFYTSKGKTLSNYDALVADVNTKKAAAQAAVAVVKSDSATFKCDGDNPKGNAQTLKADLKKEIAALKEYKTAVRKLVTGVKSVQGSASSADNKNGGQR